VKAVAGGTLIHPEKLMPSKIDELVKSPRIVMPDSISAGDGIFDRHPELFEITGFRLSPE
jgi:hypothetical protein